VAELVTTAAIHPNVIAGETPTLSPIAPASPSDLDQQHELGQFLTPNPVARRRGWRGQFTPEFVRHSTESSALS